MSATPGPRHAADIVFDGIRERLTLLATGIDVISERVSPDGKTLLLGASVAGQQNLYTYSIDARNRTAGGEAAHVDARR